METLEINVEPKEGLDELLLDGVATQIECDDDDLSPARENVKFFSQDSISNRSLSTEQSAHEIGRAKHFQRLGSAAFVGMEGLSSPNPGGGGRGGLGGRGVPVRRRTFHNGTGTPGASSSADDNDISSVQNAAAAASAFLNMPPPRTRQNNLPVTPSVPPAGQSAGPESDQKSGTETQTQRRPSSMFVRRSVVESLFGNDEPESGNNAIDDSNGSNGGNNSEVDGKRGEVGTDSRENTESGEDAALAAATAAATLYNTSLNTHPGTNSSTTSHAASTNAAQATAPLGGAPHVFNTRSSSDDSVYNHIVRSVPSLEGETGNQMRKERGLSIPARTEETVAGIANDDEEEVETTDISILNGVFVAATTAEDNDNIESSVVQEETAATHTVINSTNPEIVHTTTTTNTSSTTESAIRNPTSASTLTSAPPTVTHDHASIHTIQPPGPNKNPAKFVAPTYVQHPVSYLKVGKGTVNISTSVSATANISAGKGKSGPNSAVSSSSGIHSSSTHNVFSSDRETSETSGATNAEKAKAMVGVGSVKDRIKKFETLKSDSTDNSNLLGDGKKTSFRRASLS